MFSDIPVDVYCKILSVHLRFISQFCEVSEIMEVNEAVNVPKIFKLLTNVHS